MAPRISAKRLKELLVTEGPQAAKAAGLRYVSDSAPGIRRKRTGKGFTYVAPDGKAIWNRSEIRRLASLAVPPAYEDVWICPNPNGHIQATARDARGRKQYRYHPRWREVRDETKYGRMILFGQKLAEIRKAVEVDLQLAGLPRRKVLATIVRLLETSTIRVGNDEYARENKSFGLTTMRDKHVDVTGTTVRFRFRGKSGKDHDVGVRDRRVARIVRKMQDLPGHELFQFLDTEGNAQRVDSADVNDYLREISGEDFTAKDFRTWAGTLTCALALRGIDPFDSQTEAKRYVAEAIKTVSIRLGNTPSVCRKCYVHPAVLETYMEGLLETALPLRAGSDEAGSSSLSSDESAVLTLLSTRLARDDVQNRPGALVKTLGASVRAARSKGRATRR